MRQLMTSTLGYPRLGENREWSNILEEYWQGRISEESFMQQMKQIRLTRLLDQQKLGINWLAGDFSFYDHVLDMTTMFGLVPKRFRYTGGPVTNATYFAMACGTDQTESCQKARWFNTDYYYIVPELGGNEPRFTENKPLNDYLEAKSTLGIAIKPVVIGPFTYVTLATDIAAADRKGWMKRLLPLYVQMLQELEQAGVDWVQFDEPCLTNELTADEAEVVKQVYTYLTQQAPSIRIMLQTYFGAVACYELLIQLPVHGIGLDCAQAKEENMASMLAYGFPSDKRLAIGLIDGQSVWRTDLQQAARLVRQIMAITQSELVLQPSCSLLHVPVTLADESDLPPCVKETLAFANEKLDELRTLCVAMNRIGTAAIAAEEKMRDSSAAVSWRSNLHPGWLSKQTEGGWVQTDGIRCIKAPIPFIR